MKKIPKWVYSIGCLLYCIQMSSAAQTLAYHESHAGRKVLQNADQNRTLKNVLSELESVYGVSFIYKSELTNLKIEGYENRNFTTIDEALTGVLKPNGLIFKKVRDNFYVVARNSNNKYIRKISNELKDTHTDISEPSNLVVDRIGRLGLTLSSIADINVSGRVTSETNEGLPGVNVTVKSTTNGTVTDANGSYRLSVPENATIVFSYIGYATEEVAVGNRTNIDVQLVPDIKSLSEVVVVGYGEQARAKVTGAISTVSSKEITALPVADVTAALQGRAAGVQITNTGSPGTNPLVRIRGIGTVGNSDPLYVIDGMPAGGLNSINPNDIESVEVLKDGFAAAIYGSRAASGVVLITTKKGVRGKPRVSVDSYYGTQKAWNLIDLLNRDQYIAYGTELQQNAGEAVPQRYANMGEFANVDTDWQKEMFRSAPIQNHTLTVSGGTENTRYNVSGGFFQQEGIMLGTGFRRGSFRSNTDFTLGKRVSIGQTFTLAFTDRRNEQQSGGRTQLQHITKMVPYIPVYDATRLGGFRAPDRLDGSDPENPVANALLRKDNTQEIKLLGTAYADVMIMDGLKYRFLVGLDMSYATNNSFSPKFDAGDFQKSGQANIGQRRFSYISPLFSNQLSYTKTFGDHTISAIAVAEQQTSVSSDAGGGGINTLSNDIQQPAGLGNQTFNGGRTDFALISYIGRLNYDFKGKYLLGASFRRDGGSRFAPGKKWGTFPSFSAGWRISEEAFMDAVPVITELKLRGSYGQTGNINIGDYRYQAALNGNFFYGFGDNQLQPAYTISTLANRDLTWETTVMSNLGLDVGLFNNQFNLSLELFNNETRDMILEVPIPPSLGYDGAPTANVGTVSNKGLEISTGYSKNTGPLTWAVNGNITFLKNKLVSLGGGRSVLGPEWYGDPLTFTEEGQAIGYFRGWVVDGIFQSQDEVNSSPTQVSGTNPAKSTAPGDLKFRDISGPRGPNGEITAPDGVIDANDRTNIGHFLPDFTYGISGNIGWKGFDVSLFFQGVQGNEIFNVLRYDTEGMTRLFNAGTAVLDRWTLQNTNTSVPRAVANDPNRNARASTRFIEDGSYLRLKNLAIGYTLPQTMLKSIGNGFVSNVRVYVSSQNLLTFTKYTGYDPEIGFRQGQSASVASGIDWGQFPQARTFLGGIQIGF